MGPQSLEILHSRGNARHELRRPGGEIPGTARADAGEGLIMKLIYEGYKGKHLDGKIGRGKWYPLYEKESLGCLVEIDQSFLASLAEGYRFTRWRVEGLSVTGEITVKILTSNAPPGVVKEARKAKKKAAKL